MLEVINKRKRKIDKENLKHVNEFYKKDVIKNQKKLFKWLAKFNKNEVIEVAPKFNKTDSIDYNEFLAFVNNANTLLLSKYKKMTDNLKVIGKLRKMLADYGVANALYSFVLIIDDFYEHDKKDDSVNKREYWIQLNNKYVDLVWDRYKTEYLNTLKEDPLLKNKASDAFNFDAEKDTELYFPKQTMDLLFGFLKKAWGHKKVTDKDFNSIYLYTLFVYYYIYALHSLMSRILLSFPTPKVDGKKNVEKKFLVKQKNKEIRKNKNKKGIE